MKWFGSEASNACGIESSCSKKMGLLTSSWTLFRDANIPCIFRAPIGVLIGMHEPKAPMRAEAASAGFNISKELGNPRYPKIQLLTIAELLDRKRVQAPLSVHSVERNVTFKKAPVAKKNKRKTRNSRS